MTEKSQHTPAPWIIAGGSYLIAKEGITIATFQNDDDWEEEQWANKRLIAAAPQLLATLKGALMVGQIVGGSKEKARAAIAAAKGEDE